MAAPSNTLSLTRLQVRAVDRWAIEQLGINSLVLMENAGRQVADAADDYLRSIAPEQAGTIAIVAGPGNNGGDGFVAARHLALRGLQVRTFLIGPPEKLSADAAANLKILQNLHCDVRQVPGPEIADFPATLREFDLLIDAIGGTGINGPLRGEMAQAVEAVNRASRPVIAVDIPTGLDCDTGQPYPPTIRAIATVTFVARKAGFDAPGAAEYTGRVIVADIGVPATPDLPDLPQPG